MEIPNESHARFINMNGEIENLDFSEKSMTEQRYSFTKTNIT